MTRQLLGAAALALAASLALSAQGRGASQGRGRGAVSLPDGPGRAEVEGFCQGCHQLGNITNSGGYTRQDWDQLISTMVAIPADRRPLLLDFLAKNFPELPRPPAVVIPGTVRVSFKEWNLPTLGSRPHDPFAAPDGSIWYTGMFANKLGRIDPATGAIKEYPLKTPQSGPHGLTMDKDGFIWFTANSHGYIGKLDPNTGDVTEYKLPDAARDPHTPLFDAKGLLWFSVQGANMVGRLDPRTGDVKVQTYPEPRSNPYGMVFTSKGVPVICEFGGNRISAIDPETMAIKEWTLPNPDARPRRIAITSDDAIWYSDYARGYLGRLNMTTGEVKEWPSPSGPKSQPYGITAIRDVIWYSETAVRPNTIVRFDPKTEKFQTWLVPGGGGVIRNVSVLKNGDIAIAESGVNKVGLVEIGNPTRYPHGAGFVAATELPDGAVPPANAEGNFIIGPAHTPPPEMTGTELQGTVYNFTIESKDSRIYPGIARDQGTSGTPDPNDPAKLVVTTSRPAPYSRKVAVYVPKQYVPGTPAPFIVGADGPDALLFTALDALIAQKRVPVMIAISIANGSGDAQGSERGLEYDTMSGRYAEFVETEVLPIVEKNYNITLTKDPDGRAAMGTSSGASAALSMAWYHPEWYRRVLSYSGTFINQQWPPNPDSPHGAWEYHERLIPNSPAKPIRIWMEVGDKDLLNPNVMRDGMHDWVAANENMARVLAAKGYHYQFVFARNAVHGDRPTKQQTLPEALEWLWQGYSPH